MGFARAQPILRAPAASLLAAGAPYWGDGEIPRPTRIAASAPARSGQAFQEGPGQADARQGQPAGFGADRSGAGGAAQSRHPAGHRRHRVADRPSAPRRGGRQRIAAAARQFLGPAGRFLQGPHRAALHPRQRRFPRSPAVRLCGQNPRRARRARSRSRQIARHRAARERQRFGTALGRDPQLAAAAARQVWREPRRGGDRPCAGEPAARRAAGIQREAVGPAPAAAPGKIRGRPSAGDQIRFRAQGRPAAGDRAAGRGHPAPRPQPGAARRHRLGQDLHHGQGDRGHPAPGPDHGAQQDAGGPALRRVPQLLPGQCGRVFRELLRLLPARSLCAAHRHLYREGILHQRADRPHAPFGHALAARARRRDHRGLGVVHLRHRLGRDLFGHDVHAQARRAHQPAPADRRPGVAAVQAHRRRLRARLVPGARRHARHLPGPLRGPGLAGEPVRRRGGIDQGVRSAHRPRDRRARLRQGLRQLALCDAAPDFAAGDLGHQAGAARGGSTSSMPAAASWRRSGSSSAPCSTSR